jgi:ATP-binding protein involved in chromosome partitioning
VRRAAEEAVSALPGVRSARAVLTAHNPAPAQSAPPAQPQGGAPKGAPVSRGRGQAKLDVPGVRAIVAVASGKGGVGKSTVAVNLALGLAARGLAVGVMDSDIYGPSIPRMVGIDRKPSSPDGKTIIPLENHGLKVMSMGFLVPEDTPMIWRGPMVVSAIEQMLRDVQWGELDVLVVDMPPGTGDAQLSLSQRVPLTGAVIVSTPQDIALIDARKGLNMFRKVDVPILGIIENMSYFTCPHCGGRTDVFAHGGAQDEAKKLGVPFLGEIPLDIKIRETSDGGHPIVVSDPDGPHAASYRKIAAAVLESIAGPRRTAPRIVIE